MKLPDGKRFAFSILDDTDDSTLENVRPVYDRLRELGFRTTKTVWPLDCPEGSRLFFAADTLQRPEYLDFVRGLSRDGFEIAFHGATMESSRRERTARALTFLKHELGLRPRIHCNHGFNRENLYWGADRFRTRPLRWLARGAERRYGVGFEGHVDGSPWFWGDLCRESVTYVRNFTFQTLDLMEVNPDMPYTLEDTPWVDQWFSTSNAPDAEAFLRLVTPTALHRLEQRRGVCIVSTHLGKGFAPGGQLDPRIDELLVRLAQRPGWFVPTSAILDRLSADRPRRPLGALALLRLEARYLLDRFRQRIRSS